MGIRRVPTHNNSNNNMIFFVGRAAASVHGCPVSLFRYRVFGVYASPTRRAPVPRLAQQQQQQGTRSRHAGLLVSSLLSGPCACMHVTYTRIIPTRVTYAQVHTGLHGAATAAAAMLHAADTDLLAIYNIIASVSRVYNT